MTDVYVLDANALLAYLGGEPGIDKIEDLLTRAATGECRLYVHATNAYELYYLFHRDRGEIIADELWSDISDLPLHLLYTLDEGFVKTAARFKAMFKMSVADSFLLAQTQLLHAQVVTSDHHELDIVDKAGLVNFYWFR